MALSTDTAHSTEIPSLFEGPSSPPLLELTLGELLDVQALRHGQRECLIIPWTGARWTYHDLSHQSSLLAAALFDAGIRHGDRVAIMAGNCEQYAAVFFAVAKLGAILVILNSAYSAKEAMHGLRFTDARVLFTTTKIGKSSNTALLRELETQGKAGPQVVVLRGPSEGYTTYEELITGTSDESLCAARKASVQVCPRDVVNLQFTSGTTGLPKAAMLTHHNLVNNSRFIGDRMRLEPADVLCCPPPLFHCFGLVLGLLAAITHGSKIVFPAEMFDASATLQALTLEQCTALHGVPAMFDSLFQLAPNFRSSHLRTGIVAGSPVPRALMKRMVHQLGMTEFTSSYGLTEASPTCFNAFTDDSIDVKLATVGTVMPHARAKIVDRQGNIVPVGVRGELCMAGYQLQAGYWNNPEKTDEAMKRDSSDGVLWLHTGDEAVFDENGYLTVLGRFKDIIIRGGENIYPLEIEERLVTHPAISHSVVVGLKDEHYGEVVCAFLGNAPGSVKPGLDEVRSWVRQALSKHKAPAHIFWFGERDVPKAIPLTGSGKVKKYELAELGHSLLRRSTAPKL